MASVSLKAKERIAAIERDNTRTLAQRAEDMTAVLREDGFPGHVIVVPGKSPHFRVVVASRREGSEGGARE